MRTEENAKRLGVKRKECPASSKRSENRRRDSSLQHPEHFAVAYNWKQADFGYCSFNGASSLHWYRNISLEVDENDCLIDNIEIPDYVFENSKKYKENVKEGLNLFSKYYMDLWD